MAVYKYYEQLKLDRERKERELTHRLVEEPALQQSVRAELKQRRELEDKSRQQQEIKDSLMEQMEKHERERQRGEPEPGSSYGLIEQMF